MNIVKIKETCLYVSNLEKTKAFYHGTLNLPIIDYQPEKHLFLRAGSSVLLCFNPEDSKQKQSPPAHFAHGNQHFAFEVPATSYQRVKEEIKTKGIEIIESVIWRRGVESFYFKDPEDNILEVVPDVGIWD